MAAVNGIFVAGALMVVVCFLLPEPSTPTVLVTAPAGGSSSSSNNVRANLTGSGAFINGSCGKTEYPDVCLSTLKGYAEAVGGNPRRLAQMAVSVSLRSARRSAAYVSYVIHQSSGGAATGGANNDRYAMEVLGDCSETLSSAAGQIRDSLREVRRMPTDAGSAEFRLRLGNAQTWMSAALSNVDTCDDEFGDVKDGQVKTAVVEKVETMRKVTANALALVNLCDAAAAD